MSSFSQRFSGHHRYFSDAIEDVFATTLYLPFTILLYWWNDLAERVTELRIVPRSTGKIMWNVGRLFFTFPLFLTKGVANLTVVPLCAVYYALKEKEPQLPRFILGQYLQKYILILNPFIKLVCLFLLACFGVRIPSGLSPALLDIVLVSVSLVYIIAALVTYLSVLSFYPLTSLVLLSSLVNLEGSYSFYRKSVTQCLDTLITFAQEVLHFYKIMSFKNKEDMISGEAIKDLPWSHIFVNNSNHAFDLSALERGATVTGLQNYHAAPNAGGRLPRFEEEEVQRLEKHPKLQENFPQLANYLLQHKNEYIEKATIITPLSLSLLKAFAEKMAAPQDGANFAEEFVKAKEAFEGHLVTVSPEERDKIEKMNLLGGTDEEYHLKNVLPEVYKGNWCKKGASRLIHESIGRIDRADDKNDNVKVFWHRDQPTHWLGLDFVLRIR